MMTQARLFPAVNDTLPAAEIKSAPIHTIVASNQLIEIKPSKESKTIFVLATGGTIAGAAKSAVSSSYQSGKLSVEELTSAIPELKDFESIKADNLFRIDSSDITSEHWLTLANKANELLKQDDIRGLVITHGTDTMEETAYFLDLVIKSNKPVVLVGSMRPSTSLSADGPMNLYNAIAVANSPEAKNRGVLVVMSDTIFDGRDVTKTHTTKVNTFAAPNSGPLGTVTCGKVEFTRNVTRAHTTATPFDVSSLDTLPEVEIVYEYAGSSGKQLADTIKRKPQGIIIAGTGDGNITLRDKLLMENARRQGIQVIRSSRTGSGSVTYNNVDNLDNDIGLISGDNLNPQKARILLMLSLTKMQNEKEIQMNFRTF